MLGSYISAAYETTSTPAAARFYAGLLHWAGVALPIPSAGENIEVRTLESGHDTLVFVFNHNKHAADANATLRVAPGAFHAFDLIAGQPLELARDLLRLTKTLEAAGLWVVRIARP